MTKIYVSYFGDSHIIKSDIFVPIQAGRALSNNILDMIGDNEGDNISEKNPFYCELTSQYWAWKNDTESDYVGLMHYRRFLDFSLKEKRNNISIHGIMEDKFHENFLKDYGLTDKVVQGVVKSNDIIIPEPFDLNQLGFSSIEDHYKNAPHHFAKDFDLARSVVSELYPKSLKYFNKMASSSLLYPANIFILKRHIFEEYSQWLFSILEKIDLLVNTADYSTQEKRFLGYLAERLFTAYILQKMDTDRSLKIQTLRRIFVKNTQPLLDPLPIPETELPIVCVSASTDQAYVPHMAALIASVLDNAGHDKFIDFIVLDGGLLEHERIALSKLSRLHPYCSIRFVDMSKQFLDLEARPPFSKGTFFRLSLPNILKNRDRVIFLDTDMIVLSDIGYLFNVNLEGKVIGAVKDLIMKTFSSMGVKSLTEKHITTYVYLSDFLGLKSRVSEYFQAGTLVFDLKQMRQQLIAEKILKDLKEKQFWFLDQDALNKNLVGKVKFLDYGWNTVTIDEEHRANLTKMDNALYFQSQKSPKIIHYAGLDKPWSNFNNPFAYYYWFYLRLTPWYEEVFLNYLNKNAKKILKRKKKNFLFRIRKFLKLKKTS